MNRVIKMSSSWTLASSSNKNQLIHKFNKVFKFPNVNKIIVVLIYCKKILLKCFSLQIRLPFNLTLISVIIIDIKSVCKISKIILKFQEFTK